MKKVISVLMIVISLLSLASLTACNGAGLFYNPSEGLIYEYDQENMTCFVKSVGTCHDSVIRIGNKKDDYVIIGIGDHAFENCPFIKEVHFTRNIQYIGDYSFADCTSITQISIPSNLIQLGAGCFKGCTILSTIRFESLEGWWAGEEHIYVNDLRIVKRYILEDYSEVVWKRNVDFDFIEYWINKIKNLL